MSATSVAWKTIFWSNLVRAAFRDDSPKGEAKRELRREQYMKAVGEEKAKLKAKQEAKELSWKAYAAEMRRGKPVPVVKVDRTLAATREERLAAVEAWGRGYPPV